MKAKAHTKGITNPQTRHQRIANSLGRDIRKTFNSVDYVGNQRYVFNINGNNFRLIVMIFMTAKSVYIRFVGTHAEYDKITDIKNI